MERPKCSICGKLIATHEPHVNWSEKRWSAHTSPCLCCSRCGQETGAEGEWELVRDALNFRLMEDASKPGGYRPEHRKCH
jgi:hypothetical protein